MKQTPRDVEDLIAQSRRGRLSSADRLELQSRLRSSLEARLLLRAGQGFERESTVLPGDDELAARLAARTARAVKRTPGQAAARVRLRPALTVAIGILAGTTAAAAGWTVAHQVLDSSGASVARPSSLESPAARRSGRRAAGAGRSMRAETSEPTVQESSSAEPVTKAMADVAPEPRVQPAAQSQAAMPLCADVFARANSARREGATVAALELYRTLEERCPRSAEAHEARLIAGMLEVEAGRAQQALAELESYLASAGSGAGAAEGLWGKARALEQLGRSAEERETLELLIATSPGSPYAQAARKRLGRMAPP